MYLDLLDKYKTDILISSELALFTNALKNELTDILGIFIQIYKKYKVKENLLGVEYILSLPDSLQQQYNSENAFSENSTNEVRMTNITAVSNPKLLQLLITKSADIVTGIAYAGRDITRNGQLKPQIELGFKNSDKDITLAIGTKLSSKQAEKVDQLQEVNTGKLDIFDNLLYSSGLESYLIKNLLSELGATFTVDFNKYNSKFFLTIVLDKFHKQSVN